MADQKTIQAALAKLWMAYPSQSPQSSDAGAMHVALWVEICGDIADRAFGAAVNEYLRSSERFMPPPGLIRERAQTLTGDSPIAKANAEWNWYTRYLEGGIPLDFEVHKFTLEVKEAVGVDGLIEDGLKSLARDKFIAEYVRLAKDNETLRLASSLKLELTDGK